MSNQEMSTEEMYAAWNDDLSVEELSRQTGLKPKTIYKRFERYRNSLEEPESHFEYENVDNNGVEFDNNEDSGDSGVDVSSNYLEKAGSSGVGPGILIGLVIVTIIKLAYWVYLKIKEWKSNKAKEKQLLTIQE